MKRLITLLLILSTVTGMAQNIEFIKGNFKDNKDGLKDALKSIKEGDEYYEQGNYYYSLALPFYEKAQAFNPNNGELNFKLGMCYLNSIYKQKALEHFNKAYSLVPTIDRKIHYFIGLGYHLDYDWKNAEYHYKLYRKILSQKDEVEEIMKVNKRLEECTVGKELMEHPIRVWIDNLGKNVNSKSAEYSAMISADESVMMFTSIREGSTGGKLDEYFHMYFEDIWICEKDGNGVWGKAKNLTEVNTDNNDATSGLSPDGRTLFVYYGKKGGGDIYVSKMEDGIWSKPKALGKNINTKDYHEASACLSFDEKQLYFVSDKPSGYGGHDIYVSQWDEDKEEWGKAENMGPIINSKYDEEGIFVHPDGQTIYFSSNGSGTMGGFDIFKSVKDESGAWGNPVNIGYPVNTPDNDQFFVVSASGRHGYYSSFRIGKGQGDRDLYMITFLGPEKLPVLNNEDILLASVASPVKEVVVEPKVEVQKSRLAILKGLIRDAKTLEPLQATIKLIDNSTADIISTFKSDSKSGKYLVSIPAGKNYGISVQKDGYLFHSENFNLPKTSDYIEYEKNIDLDKIEVGKKVILRNIFYAFDKFDLLPESEVELKTVIKLLNENPAIKIEMGSHTDSRGASAYNQSLSEKRAKSVVDYLVARGISKDRLTFKGYGETVLIHSDAEIAALPTKTKREAMHKENRRTEFTIISK